AILLCGILLFATTGCNKTKEQTPEIKEADKCTVKPKVESQIDIENTKVSLTLKEETLTNTGATFVLKNKSKNSITYGEPYWIEKEENGKWYVLETINDLVFNLPAYELKTNKSKELKIDFEYGYGKLASGKYRLVKKVTIDTKDNSEDLYVAAEFVVE
ncbi:MAG: hypothetical protein K2H20_02660, partial [Bacilli bacterium]|nr:hypothetical protein [Bacilli bacterium]